MIITKLMLRVEEQLDCKIDDILRQMSKEGKSAAAIARALSSNKQTVSDRAVRRWIDGFGITRNKNNATKPGKQELKEAYSTQTAKELAARYGVCEHTMGSWLSGYDINKRDPSHTQLLGKGYEKPTKEQLISWLDKEGLSTTEIAKIKFEGQISGRLIRYFMAQYQIPTRGISPSKISHNDKSRKNDEVPLDIEELLKNCEPRPYSITDTFERGTVINHPKFGLGYVSGVLPKEIEVYFKSSKRNLIQNRV
jgi:transposase-like protein